MSAGRPEHLWGRPPRAQGKPAQRSPGRRAISASPALLLNGSAAERRLRQRRLVQRLVGSVAFSSSSRSMIRMSQHLLCLEEGF